MELGFKSVVLALAFICCIAAQAVAQDTGSIVDDVRKSFQNESLFNISASTGMSPGVPGPGVRYPPVVAIAVPLVNAAGTWALELRDIYAREMYLNLTQNGDAIQGLGTVGIGNNIRQATASGTVFGNRMLLYVTPIGGQDLYRLSLTVTSTSINGDYIYSALGVEQPGIAYGSRTSAQVPTYTQAPIYGQTYGQQSVILVPNNRAYAWNI
jgi:hypothetical protein